MKPHNYPGRLFIVEGIDGSGKSTQIELLYKWLLALGYNVFFSEWNSSPLVKSTTRFGKRKRMFTPTTFSLIHATDFADRLENFIVPLLKAGVIVLADRYAYTAFARDVARGVSPRWVRHLYDFAVQPDIAFYFRIPLEVSMSRVLSQRVRIKYYEAGMDIGLAEDAWESFKRFQERIVQEYEAMVEEFNLTVLDGSLPIEEQQREMRRITQAVLARSPNLRRAPLTFPQTTGRFP
jgi:dTMP kinase